MIHIMILKNLSENIRNIANSKKDILKIRIIFFLQRIILCVHLFASSKIFHLNKCYLKKEIYSYLYFLKFINHNI